MDARVSGASALSNHFTPSPNPFRASARRISNPIHINSFGPQAPTYPYLPPFFCSMVEPSPLLTLRARPLASATSRSPTHRGREHASCRRPSRTWPQQVHWHSYHHGHECCRETHRLRRREQHCKEQGHVPSLHQEWPERKCCRRSCKWCRKGRFPSSGPEAFEALGGRRKQ